MPCLVLFFGVVTGILVTNAGAFGVLFLAIFLLFAVYRIFITRYALVVWMFPLLVGTILGAIEGIRLLSNQLVIGDICEGHVVKEYTYAVSVKADTCAENDHYKGISYVACIDNRCPNIYDRVQFSVTSTERLGRFTGKGKILQKIQDDTLSPRVFYFVLLRSGHDVKLGYYRWLKETLPGEEAALVSSMLFGDTELPRSLTEKMKGVGVLHIVAISGINITYLQSLIHGITRRLNRKWRMVLEMSILVTLFFIVGEAVSLIGAMTMSFLGIFERAVGMRPTIWTFLAGLVIVLVIDPNYFWDAGFLLVSGACVGVYLGGSALGKYVKLGALRDFVQGVVVWISVAPVQLVIFGNVTFIGVILGFIVSPLVEILTLFGYISFVGRFIPGVSIVLKYVLGVICSLILLAINLFHALGEFA